MEIEEALKKSKIPGSVFCQNCNEDLFSPMDKLSIYLYGKCSSCLEDDSIQQKNLIEIANAL